MVPEDEPPPAPSSRSSSTDDFCYIFLVELERGPSGLGMGLIDGMVSGPWLGSWLQKTPSAHEGARDLAGASLWNVREGKGPHVGATPSLLLTLSSDLGVCPGPVRTVTGSSAGLHTHW